MVTVVVNCRCGTQHTLPVPLQGRNRLTSDQPPFADHLVIPLVELTDAGTELRVDANYLRIVSPIRIEITADQHPVANIVPPFRPPIDTATCNECPMTPVLAPAMDFVIRRQVDRLKLALDLQTSNDTATKDLWGDVHVYIGRGGVEDVGPGAPLSVGHIYSDGPFAATTFRFSGPYYVDLHQDFFFAATPPSARRYIPSRVQLTEVVVTPTFVSPSNLSRFIVYWRSRSGNHFQLYNTANISAGGVLVRERFVFDPPIELPGYSWAEKPAPANEGLVFLPNGFGFYTALEFNAYYKVWM